MTENIFYYRTAILVILVLTNFLILISYVNNLSILNNRINDMEERIRRAQSTQAGLLSEAQKRINEEIKSSKEGDNLIGPGQYQLTKISDLQIPEKPLTQKPIETDSNNPGILGR